MSLPLSRVHRADEAGSSGHQDVSHAPTLVVRRGSPRIPRWPACAESSWPVARARGAAQAFVIGKDHIADESVALILDDNLFYGAGLGLQPAKFNDIDGAVIFGNRV